MATLGEYTEYDEWLKWLVEAQRYKLRLNAKKGFLGDVPPDRLLTLLKGEIAELEDAAARGSQVEMILEAADIANFALGFVIAAVKGLKKEEEPVTSDLPTPVDICGKCHCSVEQVRKGVQHKGMTACPFMGRECPHRGLMS